MNLRRLIYLAGCMLAAFTLSLSTGCDRKTPQEKEIQDLTQKAAELDKLSQQAQTAGTTQNQALKQAGAGDVQLSAETMQLTEDQKRVLEERIKGEKNSSYAAILQEVIDKDKEIKELNQKISKLRAILPRPDIAKANDSHYGMALRFLKKRGIKEAQARTLVARVNLMEKMAPGFEVYHFYSNGVYGSWVAQGKATITPNELQKQEREKIEGERDTAVAAAEKLQEEVLDLMAQKKQVQEDIAALQTEKQKMQADMASMSAANEEQKAKLNSLHYVVGSRKQLEKDGVIVVPVFAKDRAGKNWADSVFNKSLDLRTSESLTISASDLGLESIRKISVVPGSLERDTHYSLTVSEDKKTAVIKFLVKDRFKNEKVAFAVAD